MSGKANRDAGARNERDVVRQLCEAGLHAERKGWHASGGYDPGDVILEVPDGGCPALTFRVECKWRKAPQFGQLYRWLSEKPNDFLTVKQKGTGEQLAVMPLSTLLLLLKRRLPAPKDRSAGHPNGCRCTSCEDVALEKAHKAKQVARAMLKKTDEPDLDPDFGLGEF